MWWDLWLKERDDGLGLRRCGRKGREGGGNAVVVAAVEQEDTLIER